MQTSRCARFQTLKVLAHFFWSGRTILLLLLFSVNSSFADLPERGTCRNGEFRCENGNCIAKEKVCDGVRDCGSGIDEYVCLPKFRRGLCGYHRTTSAGPELGQVGLNVISSAKNTRLGIFQCRYGGCIPLNKLCDGSVNCIGGSDESEICEQNSCLPGQFRCKYGACIPDWQMCNGRAHCPDGSDETPEACQYIKCQSTEFRCRYGGCIPKSKICNIKKDCADGSDEFDFLCLITRAKMVEQWGSETKAINEEQEKFIEKLRSRSRTTTTIQTTTPQPPTISTTPTAATATDQTEEDVAEETTSPTIIPTSCSLPPIPPNAEVNINCKEEEEDCGTEEGSRVPPGVLLEYKCAPGYLLYGTQTLSCGKDGNWSSRPPECDPLIDVRFGFGSAIPRSLEPRCPSIPLKAGVRVECHQANQSAVPSTSSCHSAGQEVGVVAKYRCAPYYAPSTPLLPTHYETCLENGVWSPGVGETFSCTSDCGSFPPAAAAAPLKTPLIVNGESSRRGEWPWHVAIYRNDANELKYICGGVLINENFVLSVAHCVTHRRSGEPKDPGDFVVFLGKQSVVLPELDPFVQKRGLANIFVEESYNPLSLDSDIALLQLAQPAVLSFYVRPACYPQSSNSFLGAGAVGTVVGFGKDGEDGLKSLEMSVLSPNQCIKNEFSRSTTYCTEPKGSSSLSVNESVRMGVCQGDSGSGMYFMGLRGQGEDGRWILQGLVSYTTTAVPCTGNLVFTRVGKYGDWIVRTLSTFVK